MLARALTNALNPFFIFTVLYAFVAFAEAGPGDAVLYLTLELLAAVAVAAYVLFMRRRRRVGDFWISVRAERLTPALFLLTAHVAMIAGMLDPSLLGGNGGADAAMAAAMGAHGVHPAVR